MTWLKVGGQLREGPRAVRGRKLTFLVTLRWYNAQGLTCILGDISWNKNQTLENQVFAIDHLLLKIRLLTAFFVFFIFLRQGHTLYSKLACNSLCTPSWVQSSWLSLLVQGRQGSNSCIYPRGDVYLFSVTTQSQDLPAANSGNFSQDPQAVEVGRECIN